MTGIVDWASARARMVLAFIAISIAAGLSAYVGLPKEGAPNIDVPVLYISVPFPGVSASDAERLVVRPLETELRGIDGLKQMTGIASQGHAALLLEFEFGWNKEATLAEVRAEVDQAQAEFPEDAEEPSINEVNLSEFPVLVVSLSGSVPERTLLRLSKELQREIESIPSVLEAELTGHRDEMIEVLIDPLRLESYNVTVDELLSVFNRNNQLVAAGSVESGTGAFSVSVPGSIQAVEDVVSLPVKVNGDRVVRLGDVTQIRRTFEDREGNARYNGEKSISLQVKKRVGENIIATVEAVRATVADEIEGWPEPLAQAVKVDFAMDESVEVVDMVGQLEASVTTAVILVMIVVLATLGFRSAILVGIAIPCSFLLAFGLMAAFGMSINNMVMFGLILAVGMLVDGAIVVVEYADKRMTQGTGPMRAYTEAARRMFWPITASTATTLCAFLPMLLWPGMPGQFMRQLPITLIFVLSASLIVALIFLPVMGGVSGRITRALSRVVPRRRRIRGAMVRSNRRTAFGALIALIVMNPVGPFLALGATGAFMVGVFSYYGQHNTGVEFFVETEPKRAIVYVRARGNLSLDERDRMVRSVERVVMDVQGVESVFAFSGEGGGAIPGAPGQSSPPDAIGQVQLELQPWDQRDQPGKAILDEIAARITTVPGVIAEISEQEDGPQQGKPIQLELRSDNWAALHQAAAIARARFEAEPGLIDIDDTRPLPGIEWEITVDRAAAGRFGADVVAIGPLVQAVTRGATLDTIRPVDADEELDVRVRFPEDARLLSTLDALKVTTANGLVPLANFISREAAPKLGEIQRRDAQRMFLVRAGVEETTSDVAEIEALEAWIAEEQPFPASVGARFTGDREEQEKSQAFLMSAFAGALGLMFVILLAQFNSVYNSLLVLSAVVMSVAGVLIGMLVMGQKFSIIMTGTGIVALAGIVVNNNIVLIDTYQAYAARMDRLEAIVRTAEARIRPVLLTTITTMAGLTPMMLAVSLDFANGRVNWGAPTALWWVQLATAVVFGLGLATVLTLVVTPAALAARVWITRGAGRGLLTMGLWAASGVIPPLRRHPWLRDRRQHRAFRRSLERQPLPEILWQEPELDPEEPAAPTPQAELPLILHPAQAIRAAE